MTFSERGVAPPEGFCTDEFVVRPVRTSDVELDYEAVMASRETLRLWEGSGWPEDDFTLEANLEDLVTMEERHRTNYAFGYTIMNPAETQCLGCIYVFPPDAKMYADVQAAAVGSSAWSDVEATVFYWVRQSRLAAGLDREVLNALRPWLDQDWAFGPYVFVTSQAFEQQVEMFSGSDLELQFELTFPGDPDKSLAFA